MKCFLSLCAKRRSLLWMTSLKIDHYCWRPHTKAECTVSQVFESNITTSDNLYSSWMVVVVIWALGFDRTLAIAWTTGPMTVFPIPQLGSVQHNHKPLADQTLHRCSQSQCSATCTIKTLEANEDTYKVVGIQSRVSSLDLARCINSLHFV